MGKFKRFLRLFQEVVKCENVKEYLLFYLEKKPKICNSQITDLRRFVRDFLN